MTNEDLIEIVQDITDETSVTLDTKLVELATWDSMAVLRFIVTVQEKADCVIDGAEVGDARTVGQLADIVNKSTSG